MVPWSEEFRAEAQRLEQRAETATDSNAQLLLHDTARRLREIADDIDLHESNIRSLPAS